MPPNRDLNMLASCLQRGLHKLAAPYLPCGLWRCADGREILFDRSYRPLWQRRLNGRVEVADPGEWIDFV
jgi:hypothetical protein